MRYQVFAVRDRASDAYGVPMFMVSRGQAIRAFSDGVNRATDDNQLFQHPEDFDLYALGHYDDNSGIFSTGVPEMICVGKDVAVREARSQLSLPLNGGQPHAS